MKIIFKIALICFLLFSCKERKKELNERLNKKEILVEQEEDLITAKKENINNNMKVKFSDLTILVKDLIKEVEMDWRNESDQDDYTYRAEKDTVYFNLIPGDWMFDKTFKIEQTEFEEIELYGQIEVKIGIETEREIEVPLCVIDNWKSYRSEWRKLKINQEDLKFIYFDESADPPIKFTIDELKIAVEKNCGAEWFDDIKNIKSLEKIDTSFFTTKYIYKIRAKNSKTNQIVEKYFIFNTPTSC
ncbi:hypothetical protein [Flavobacterium tructae]|uniref:hypothetical protein n=1 Tax=Flavobacterium tructae TaxID=1114873 RepID=UPI0035A88CC2